MELTTNEADYENYQHELDELNDDDEEEKKRDNLDGLDLDREVLDNNIPDIVNQEQVEQVPTFVMDDHNRAETESMTENDFYQPNKNQDDNNRKMGEEENSIQVDEIIENNAKDAEENQGQTHSHNLRPNRERDYYYRFTFLSVREGLKKFGQKGREAILDELKLFLDEQVFKTVKNITDEQQKRALWIHCILTEKRDGRIKARAVADGRSQMRYTMEEIYSPTVKLESIMLCTLIEALEGRYVATVDIKGAFLKAKVPDDMELIVKMDGELAETFVKLNPIFTLDEHGMLYLQCDKALYGHIGAARLFYHELDDTLQNKMGFEQNQYDPCVYNKVVNADIVTIKTHVDDLKISAVKKENMMEAVEQLRSIYREIKVHDGDVHDYLGMVMEHNRESKTVKINMKKSILYTLYVHAETRK